MLSKLTHCLKTLLFIMFFGLCNGTAWAAQGVFSRKEMLIYNALFLICVIFIFFGITRPIFNIFHRIALRRGIATGKVMMISWGLFFIFSLLARWAIFDILGK